MTYKDVADVATVGLAVVGAGCVLYAALFITVPERMPATADMTNFDWLTVPVAQQAFWTKLGAASTLISLMIPVVTRAVDRLVG